MAKYRVHFIGYYGYDVEIEANNEEEARELATPIFENADANDFYFENDGADIFEVALMKEGFDYAD